MCIYAHPEAIGVEAFGLTHRSCVMKRHGTKHGSGTNPISCSPNLQRDAAKVRRYVGTQRTTAYKQLPLNTENCKSDAAAVTDTGTAHTTPHTVLRQHFLIEVLQPTDQTSDIRRRSHLLLRAHEPL